MLGLIYCENEQRSHISNYNLRVKLSKHFLLFPLCTVVLFAAAGFLLGSEILAVAISCLTADIEGRALEVRIISGNACCRSIS